LKKCPIFQKIAQTVAKPKKAKISSSKLSLKVKKYQHHTTFETLK
jgi:hypothetical protein